MNSYVFVIVIMNFWIPYTAGSSCKEVIPQMYFNCMDSNFSSLPKDLPESLVKLDLSFNPLRHLTSKYFSHVYNLQYLDLTRCSITVIDDLAFLGLDKLFTLVLTGNPVSHWTPLSLFGLHSLQRLIVVETSISSLYELPVENLTTLRELNAGSNLLTSLQIPAYFTFLHKLDLHANKIKEINERDLEALRGANTSNFSLILSSNRIRYFTHTAFRNVTLNKLQIQGCFSNATQMKTVLKAFSGLKVVKLEIGHYRRYDNTKISFQKELLEGLCDMAIEELIINGMLFPVPPDTLFNCIKNTVSLRVVNTDMDIFTFVNGSSKLQKLELKNSMIKFIPSIVLSKLPSLQEIRITNTPSIPSFTSPLPELKKLELLDLSRNQLTMETCCNKFLGRLPALLHLNLSYNERISFKSVFLNMPQLQSLDVSHSTVDTVGKFPIFNLLVNLKYLDLSFTYCHYVIDCSFCGLPNLEKLSVSRSTFENSVLGSIFQNLTQLRSLDLSACSLGNLPKGTFFGLKHLQELDMSKNRLLDIQPSVITQLSMLNILDLSSNQFPGIAKETINALPNSLSKVDLSYNPFDCSCRESEFILWVHEQKEKLLHNSNKMLCNSPKNIKGLQLSEVASSNCLMPLFIVAGVLSIIFFIFIIYRCYINKYLPLLQHFFCQKIKPEQVSQEEYDAFVIYSSGDEEWVRGQLVPRLEGGSPQFQLCLHYRDFPPGVPITTSITDSILRSRKAIVVISPNFMESRWCSHEFEMVKAWQFMEKKTGIIAILLQPVRKDELKKVFGLHKYLSNNTYLEWKDHTDFWRRLRKALSQGNNSIVKFKDNDLDIDNDNDTERQYN
ncbi:toll-like receptor 4 [Bombina bombina]|uniref:toll-like receptor 4 n=1 Tax=Bombina bombina TaxID=8345 RepID=UPI00235B24F1|nr:toll-like receptor 4 [Bombina bombina]